MRRKSVWSCAIVLLMAWPAGAQPVPLTRLATANWQTAGVTPNGGIPARTTICATLRASTYNDGVNDAAPGIQAAVTACPVGQTVLLSAGTFKVLSVITVNKGITVRGAGAGVTTLKKTNGVVRPARVSVGQPTAGDPSAIFIVGASPFPHFQNGSAVTLTANATQGARSVTLASVAGLSVGQFVEVAEDQFYTGTWQTMPLTSGAANPYQVWGGDRVNFSRYRLAAAPSATVVSSQAIGDTITTAVAHHMPVNALIWLNTSHVGATFSPAYTDGKYFIVTVPTSTTMTLKTYESQTAVDITIGGTGGGIESGRAYTTFSAGPADGPLGWFNRGLGYLYGEVKEISAIVGRTVTFTSPFTDTYRTTHAAKVAISDTAYTSNAGIESMTLFGGARGAIEFLAAAKSWAKNVEIVEWGGHGIEILASHRIEVTGCYIRRAAWPVPGGGGYAIALTDNSSEALITNTITIDTNKNIVANAGGAGSVVSYNYFDDSYIWYDETWQEVSANASHFAGPHHVLFEGNRAVNFDSDFTHGSAYSHTILRNHLVGTRLNVPGSVNSRTLGLNNYQKNFSAIGNVLGLPGQMTGWLLTYAGSWFTEKFIYKIGYEAGDANQAEETSTTTSFIEGDNYNYLNNNIRTAATDVVPNSYYLSAAPSFFGTCAWPWVTSRASTKYATLPAKARYDAGQGNDTVTDRCGAVSSGAGIRRRLRGE